MVPPQHPAEPPQAPASCFLSPLCHAVEGSHGNDGLLLGRPQEEPDQPITDKSLLEIIDGIVMMYNLSVHQQLGKVSPVPHLTEAAAILVRDPPLCLSKNPNILVLILMKIPQFTLNKIKQTYG